MRCSPLRQGFGRALLSSKPALWFPFLILFNLVVAAVAPCVVDGAWGVATAVGMGIVLGAGSALLKGRKERQHAA
ncbi:hypothetical protein [Streptomyces sp. NPDC097610]|uniref:hypothetical protein n=1 Tax=Streptomyces sp. NPDC097610 TaxID=3157227 RepID=UPI00332C973B